MWDHANTVCAVQACSSQPARSLSQIQTLWTQHEGEGITPVCLLSSRDKTGVQSMC